MFDANHNDDDVAAGGFALASLAVATPAGAMPANGSATPALLANETMPQVTLVSGGCGPFRHRAFNGFCYPNGGYRYGGYYRPGFFRPYGWNRGWGWRRHW